MRTYWFTDGLFVVGSTKEYTETLGTKIIQIGNKTPEELRSLVSPVIPYSTVEALDLVSLDYILSPELLHSLKVIENMENALFIFEDNEGNSFQLNLSPYDSSALSEEDIKRQKFGRGLSTFYYTQNPLWETALKDINENSYPLYLKNPFSFYWFEYLEEFDTVYFQFNACADMPEGDGFSEFFKKMLDFIEENNVGRLVIDLRFNGGGNFRVAESQFKNLGKHRLNEERQIFTIIGRNTGSACIVNAMQIKEKTNSMFVGEGVADTLEMYVNNLPVYLPNSNLCFVVACGPRVFPDTDEQILPDVEIKMSSEDYLSGKDVMLEYILHN